MRFSLTTILNTTVYPRSSYQSSSLGLVLGSLALFTSATAAGLGLSAASTAPFRQYSCSVEPGWCTRPHCVPLWTPALFWEGASLLVLLFTGVALLFRREAYHLLEQQTSSKRNLLALDNIFLPLLGADLLLILLNAVLGLRR